MDYHQSIAAVCAAPCEQTVAALSRILSAHGYQLERSFELSSARHAARTNGEQYLVLLAYEQTAPAPPMVITAHECEGITRLQIVGLPPSAAFMAVFEEVASSSLDTA